MERISDWIVPLVALSRTILRIFPFKNRVAGLVSTLFGEVDMQMVEGERSSSVEAAVATDPGNLVDMEEPERPRLPSADPAGNVEVGSSEVLHDGYLDGIEEPTEATAVVTFVLNDSAIENGSRCDV